MKVFLRDIVLFFVLIAGMAAFGLLLPPTPRSANSSLQAQEFKDSLLKNVNKPRIIFVGGSNMSFGINSQTIADSLQFNSINTAIHANLGLKWMMNNTSKYVQPTDVIILVPEYEQFYNSQSNGAEELLRTVLEVKSNNFLSLDLGQFMNILPYIPKYILSKLNPSEYQSDTKTPLHYTKQAFNDFGDIQSHWGLIYPKVNPIKIEIVKIDDQLLRAILAFHKEVKAKGGKLFLSFPGMQLSSLENNLELINEVCQYYESTGIPILGTPKRYGMADSLLFDSPYHLNKKGADLRTKLLIEDFNIYLDNSSF